MPLFSSFSGGPGTSTGQPAVAPPMAPPVMQGGMPQPGLSPRPVSGRHPMMPQVNPPGGGGNGIGGGGGRPPSPSSGGGQSGGGMRPPPGFGTLPGGPVSKPSPSNPNVSMPLIRKSGLFNFGTGQGPRVHPPGSAVDNFGNPLKGRHPGGAAGILGDTLGQAAGMAVPNPIGPQARQNVVPVIGREGQVSWVPVGSPEDPNVATGQTNLGNPGQQSPGPVSASETGANLMATLYGLPAEALEGMMGELAKQGGGIYGEAKAGWEAGNPAPDPFMQQLEELLGQYGNQGQTGLMDAVGANMGQMMDPAVWEQMMANRIATGQEQALGGLNMSERRIRDAASRGGFAPGQGGLSQAYADYGSQMNQVNRDVFNDTLGQQMAAANQAAQFGLGQQGQMNQEEAAIMDMLAKAGMLDKGMEWENYTSFEDILNNMASMVGGAGQMVGDLAGAAGSVAPALMGA